MYVWCYHLISWDETKINISRNRMKSCETSSLGSFQGPFSSSSPHSWRLFHSKSQPLACLSPTPRARLSQWQCLRTPADKNLGN